MFLKPSFLKGSIPSKLLSPTYQLSRTSILQQIQKPPTRTSTTQDDSRSRSYTYHHIVNPNSPLNITTNLPTSKIVDNIKHKINSAQIQLSSRIMPLKNNTPQEYLVPTYQTNKNPPNIISPYPLKDPIPSKIKLCVQYLTKIPQKVRFPETAIRALYSISTFCSAHQVASLLIVVFHTRCSFTRRT